MSVHFTQVGGRDVRGERLHAAVVAAEADLAAAIADEIAVKDARSVDAPPTNGQRQGVDHAEAFTREAREALIAARNAAALWFNNPHAIVSVLDQLLAQWLEAYPDHELADATREALAEDDTPQHRAG